LTPILLGAAVVISALVVVKTKHENRTLVHEIEQLRAEKARLETEWAQLQLEEATLAHHGRVEQIARDKLGMTEPRDVQVVAEQPQPVADQDGGPR
ncbi:MAG: cell division protein FtsL, partial [Hydrocarboniphaga effusa]|nr:cell division protein FtsL [Hydrocarboniphaga effusa]